MEQNTNTMKFHIKPTQSLEWRNLKGNISQVILPKNLSTPNSNKQVFISDGPTINHTSELRS
jgi:hypothetical protein